MWYKARVDTYGGAQKYEVTWETGGSEWLAKLVDAEYEMAVPPAPSRCGGESTRQRTAGGRGAPSPAAADAAEDQAPPGNSTGLPTLPAHVLEHIAKAVLLEESAGSITGADASPGLC